LITLACILGLFIGAMAKSAQMPLHVWLPDSMEGPTRHFGADTCCDDGDSRRIFLLARMSPLFEHTRIRR
jgi:NADH-quinone oxidoreductase subunit L